MGRHLWPLGGFIALLALLAAGLKLDPRLVPSPLIDKPAPDFSLPTLADPKTRLARADLLGRVTLLNVWASWCVVCREEQPLLVDLPADPGYQIIGLNYKDEPAAAQQWLNEYGNPFVKIAVDADGRTGIDYGVYGVPETYLIDRRGIIRYKQIGPLTEEALRDKVFPLIEKLKHEQG